MDIENYIWRAVNYWGWWWWAPVMMVAAYNLYLLYTLAPAVTPLGKLTRIILTLGLLLYALSWGNNAFGLIGAPLIMYGLFGILYQQKQKCLAEGKIVPKDPTLPITVRVANTMVDQTMRPTT